MSRYRVEPCKVSKTLNIYGPGGQILGKICGADDPETLRFVRFIEAHDEIMEMLRNAASDMHQVFSALSRSNIQDAFELTNEMDALVDRLEGEEAQ